MNNQSISLSAAVWPRVSRRQHKTTNWNVLIIIFPALNLDLNTIHVSKTVNTD